MALVRFFDAQILFGLGDIATQIIRRGFGRLQSRFGIRQACSDFGVARFRGCYA